MNGLLDFKVFPLYIVNLKVFRDQVFATCVIFIIISNRTYNISSIINNNFIAIYFPEIFDFSMPNIMII